MVIDRLSVKAASKQRLTDSVESALGLSGGLVLLDFVDLAEDDPHRERKFSEHLACPNDHPLAIEDLEPRVFSFNAPYGACPECTGLGTKKEVDPELLVPDVERSLREGAIQPWSGGSTLEYFLRLLEALATAEKFSIDTPWRQLPSRAQKTILYGSEDQVHVRYRNKFGRERSYFTGFEGVVQWIERRHSDTESDWSRDKYEGYMRDVPCAACGGARLKPEVLAVTIAGRSIAEVCNLSVGECAELLASFTLTDRQKMIAERVLKEINARLRFLVDVGLDYLSLDRGAGTLSGGEAQRIRLATQIGSGLVGVLYVLDEPSIGLHQRDNHRLIETLVRLKKLGNTLIVVEHDEDTIRTADWIVDIGPGAGEHGGRHRAQRFGGGAAGQPGVADRGVPVGPQVDPHPGDAPARVGGPGAGRAGRPRAQPAEPDRRLPARAVHRGHRGERVGQVDAGQRHPLHGAGEPDQQRPDGAGPAHPDHRAGARRQGRRGGPVARSGAPRGPTRRRTPGCSTMCGGCSPRPPRRRCAATARAGSRSTSRAGAARRAPATARSRSR